MTTLRDHWCLDPDLTLLNHGSFGACPRVVLETQAELRAEMERSPVRFLGREFEDRLDGVREVLGPFLGAQPEDLVFVPNATTAVNSVLRSMALEAGDEVIYTDQGYNACNNAVDYVTARAGARPVVVSLPFPVASADELVEAILARVTPRTRLALLDHVTSPTALVLPLETLVPALRERGVEVLIDGAHAPGMLPLDLDALGAGYVTGNCHKWMCCPKGSAYLHVRRDLQPGVRPAVISHGANDKRTARSRFRIEFDWMGTIDPTAVLSIPSAVAFFDQLLPGGWDELRQRNHRLACDGRRELNTTLGLADAAPESMLGSMAAITLPDGNPEPRASAFDVDPLQRALFDDHGLEVPISPWPRPDSRLLRISAQAYNDLADYRRLAAALEELLV